MSIPRIIELLISFAILIIAMSVHEFSHGWAAYKLGDPTAKYSGRFTLNPLAHIDPVGTIILPLLLFFSTGGRFLFGYAKPEPVNFSALRNPRRDIIWVGLAGPLSNIIFAAIASIILRLVPLGPFANSIMVQLIVINAVLAVFNLMPIPPLDGSRILMGLLPQQLAMQYASLEPFGFIILMLLIFTGTLWVFISPLLALILRLFGVPY
ncbi:MAG: site-2 protease family protein [Candidatus Omnitrophica bacterium]|nr:site-2 protease family protein [Candidatus Omnitrophota bacterium]